MTVNVNVSARHFIDPALISSIETKLRRHDVEPDALTLELTESLLLSDSSAVRRQFREIRDLGVRIALDDFGTGYSSLSYLEQYQFDLMKIDKSFIKDLSTQQVRRRLTEIILAVGNVIDVVAESIESVQEERILRNMNCKLGQGYLHAKPMSRHDADHYLFSTEHTGRLRIVTPEIVNAETIEM